MAPAPASPSKRSVLHGLVPALLVQRSVAMWSQGNLALKTNSTVFLSKFCFTYAPQEPYLAGEVDVQVRLPAGLAGGRGIASSLMVMFFDDEDTSYPGPSADWASMSCQERASRARSARSIDWPTASRPEGELISFTIRQKVRPRWWYVAVSDCSNVHDDIRLDYDVHVWNPAYGWGAEFGTDRHLLPILLAILALAFAGLSGAQLYANRTVAAKAQDDSSSSKAMHPFARILTAGVLLGLGDCVALLAHLCMYAVNGVGVPSCQVLSQLLSVMMNFVLASLLLLISQGKCISYIMVSRDGWEMLRLLGPFLFACCILEAWGENAISRNYTTNYVYTTPIGWMLISIDMFLLGKYFIGLRKTYHAEHSHDVAKFYRRWGCVYGLWFMVLPVTALLAQFLLAPYAWLIVSTGAKKSLSVLMFFALVVGLWPENTRTHFTKLEMVELQPLPGLLGDRSPRRQHSGRNVKFSMRKGSIP